MRINHRDVRATPGATGRRWQFVIGHPLSDHPVILQMAGIGAVHAKVNVGATESDDCLAGRFVQTIGRRFFGVDGSCEAPDNLLKTVNYRFKGLLPTSLPDANRHAKPRQVH